MLLGEYAGADLMISAIWTQLVLAFTIHVFYLPPGTVDSNHNPQSGEDASWLGMGLRQEEAQNEVERLTAPFDARHQD